jgi:transmembrane sensor
MEKEYIWNLIAKKLAGEASAEELHDLESQLRSNPELHYSMQTIIDLWTPAISSDQEVSDLAFEKHIKRMEKLGIDFSSPKDNLQTPNLIDSSNFPSQLYFTRPKKILIGLGLCILFITGLLWGAIRIFNPVLHQNAPFTANLPPDNATSEITTRNGSKTNVVLPDGTQVWLNAGSKLSYPKSFGNTNREVVLTGEAFFDVVHNTEKPFIIHTVSMNIKVLGTRFNVKSYPNDKATVASLIRGSIEVSFKDRPAEKIILKPNEKIIVANSNNPVIKPIKTKLEQEPDGDPIVAVRGLTYYQHGRDVVETSWVENKLIFQNESFEDLARQLERWYNVDIRFKNPEMQLLYFTGDFKNESIIQALDALKISNNFNYIIEGNNITILK